LLGDGSSWTECPVLLKRDEEYIIASFEVPLPLSGQLYTVGSSLTPE